MTSNEGELEVSPPLEWTLWMRLSTCACWCSLVALQKSISHKTNEQQWFLWESKMLPCHKHIQMTIGKQRSITHECCCCWFGCLLHLCWFATKNNNDCLNCQESVNNVTVFAFWSCMDSADFCSQTAHSWKIILKCMRFQCKNGDWEWHFLQFRHANCFVDSIHLQGWCIFLSFSQQCISVSQFWVVLFCVSFSCFLVWTKWGMKSWVLWDFKCRRWVRCLKIDFPRECFTQCFFKKQHIIMWQCNGSFTFLFVCACCWACTPASACWLVCLLCSQSVNHQHAITKFVTFWHNCNQLEPAAPWSH